MHGASDGSGTTGGVTMAAFTEVKREKRPSVDLADDDDGATAAVRASL